MQISTKANTIILAHGRVVAVTGDEGNRANSRNGAWPVENQ
jgi:hypothetical protein